MHSVVIGTVVVDLLLAVTMIATESTAEFESNKLKSQAPAYIQTFKTTKKP